MRDLITAHRIPAITRQPGRTGRNLYPAAALRAIPAPNQGARHDLTGQRIGQTFAAARIVADTRKTRTEHDKIWATCLDGNPAAIPTLLAAVRRWVKNKPDPAAAIVEELAKHIGELPKVLPMSMRLNAIIADASARPHQFEGGGAPG